MDHVMEILDASGHLTLSWDPADPDSVTRAVDEFARLKAAGYAFFATPADHLAVNRLKPAAFVLARSLDVRPVQVREFSPRSRRTVAVRPMRGG